MSKREQPSRAQRLLGKMIGKNAHFDSFKLIKFQFQLIKF